MSDALEALILQQLSSLSLSTEPDTVEFVKGIVDEDTIEPEVSPASSVVSLGGACGLIWGAVLSLIATGQEDGHPRLARARRRRSVSALGPASPPSPPQERARTGAPTASLAADLVPLGTAESASDKLDTLLTATQEFTDKHKANEAAAAVVAEKAKKAEFEAKLAAGKGMALTKEQATDRKAALLAVSSLPSPIN